MGHQFGPGYPLSIILGAFFFLLTKARGINDPVLAVNLMSVVLSSCCIPLFYQIVKKLFNERTALLSALLLSLSPIFLAVSIYGMSHAPALFFLLLGIFFLISNKNSPKDKTLVWAGISIGLLGATRIQDMILMFIPLTLLLFIANSSLRLKDKIKNLCLFWFMAALFCLLAHLPYLSNQNSSTYHSQLKEFWRMGTSDYFHLFCPACLQLTFDYFLLNSGSIGVLLSLLGLIFLLAARTRFSFFYLSWIFCLLLYYGNVYTIVPRYLVIVLPPFVIAQGYLLNRFMTKTALFKIVSLVIFFIVICVPFQEIYPILLNRHQHTLLPDYARWVNSLSDERSIVICADDCAFIEYYGKRAVMTKPVPTQFAEYKQKLDNLLNNGSCVYLTIGGLFAYDPNRDFSNFLLENYKVRIVGNHPWEDWHRGCLSSQVYQADLFQIEPKNP